MWGRKGMSPIIATILLIAFAVALGAVIMNWSSTLVAGGAKENACGGVMLTIRTPVCFAEDKINVEIMNTGEQEIASIILELESPDFHQEYQLKNSKMAPNSVFIKSVPGIRPESASVKLYAMVDIDGELETCEEPAHSAAELPDC